MLEQVTLGGLEQWLSVSGTPQSPVLLYLHGGPGTSELAVAQVFQKPLAAHLQLINWDQRGAGKTSGKDLSLTRLVEDTCELAQLLRRRYPGRALYLLGHSWGSFLGLLALQRDPKLCDGFISVGQLVAGAENEVRSHHLAVQRARRCGPLRRALLSEPPPYGTNADALLRKCVYLYLLGGFFRRRRALGLSLRLLRSPAYTLAEKLGYLPRFRASLKQLQPVIETRDLLRLPLNVEVPVLFCVGRRDLVTPPELAERLLEHLTAPRKQLEVFEREAHCLHYEAPEAFARVVLDWLAAKGP